MNKVGPNAIAEKQSRRNGLISASLAESERLALAEVSPTDLLQVRPICEAKIFHIVLRLGC